MIGLWRLLRGRVARADIDLETARQRPLLLVDPGPEISGYLWRHRAELSRWLAGVGREHVTPGLLSADLARRLVRWLQGRNQFLDADPGLLGRVRGAYAACVAETETLLQTAPDEQRLQAGLRDLFERHHARLGEILVSAYGGRLKDAPWSQYSPDLQMAVLRLEEPLGGPVLDVGCGADGALPMALRRAGHQVTGFDRDPAGEGLLTGDWLDFDYGTMRWGVVISHLGFSLHFLHQHLAGTAAAFDYARAYRRILASLKPGGVFAYAPALPFIEDLLPEGFAAERSVWDAKQGGLFSSCRVTRR